MPGQTLAKTLSVMSVMIQMNIIMKSHFTVTRFEEAGNKENIKRKTPNNLNGILYQQHVLK